MNADGKGLFAAICADPEDDASRLVYADWLDEQGDPRADYLRLLATATADDFNVDRFVAAG